jgi:tRNA A37 threonylcarbamoyladenosine biosynthesis protein TsaE
MQSRNDVVYAIEWSENIEAALPEDTIFVRIEPEDETTRRIAITGRMFPVEGGEHTIE